MFKNNPVFTENIVRYKILRHTALTIELRSLMLEYSFDFVNSLKSSLADEKPTFLFFDLKENKIDNREI